MFGLRRPAQVETPPGKVFISPGSRVANDPPVYDPYADPIPFIETGVRDQWVAIGNCVAHSYLGCRKPRSVLLPCLTGLIDRPLQGFVGLWQKTVGTLTLDFKRPVYVCFL